jgi:hypothetical protein
MLGYKVCSIAALNMSINLIVNRCCCRNLELGLLGVRNHHNLPRRLPRTTKNTDDRPNNLDHWRNHTMLVV